MRRASTFYFCLLAVLVGMPISAVAQGGGAGWIERFSGPGPWDGWEFHYPFACIAKPTASQGTQTKQVNEVKLFNGCFDPKFEVPSWWFEVEYGRYNSEDDPLVNNTDVHLDRVEVRATTPVSSTGGIVELGFGAGAYRFSGDGFDFWKVALPVRLAVLPLNRIERFGRWGSVFQLWGKGTFVAGRLSGDDFGVPASGFNENWEFVFSGGIIIDFRDSRRPRQKIP